MLHKGFPKLYQNIPFVWNYFDMLMPYEVLHSDKLNKDCMIDIISKLVGNLDKVENIKNLLLNF